MKMTEELKKWLIANCGVKEDATDEEFRTAAGTAIANGKLAMETYAKLTAEPEAEEANEFGTKLDVIAEKLGTLAEALVQKKAEPESKDKTDDKTEDKTDKPDEKDTTPKPQKDGDGKPTDMEKAIGRMGGTPTEPGKADNIRVKEAAESYSTTKGAMCYPKQMRHGGAPHPLAEQQVTYRGRPMETSSDLDKALAGVWAKYQILCVTPKFAGNPRMAWERLTEHERSLMHHLYNECEWDDSTDDYTKTCKGFPGGGKGIKQALIDDALSGGLEAAPIVFDDQVIETPLMYGELYPLVNEVPLDRGRRVEGVAIQTVTGAWGGVDDTAVALFNTAAYVAAFDTTIYRWEGAVRIGLDFLSDTPINFGQTITRQYGERLLEDLDDVIATGAGGTQPLGITNTGTVTAVAWGGATSIGNYESLLFGVHVREKKPNVMPSAAFCGTWTSYQRARGLAVGGTDVRRLFGHNYSQRTIMETPYKINESLTNRQIFYFLGKRYRMYRRKGFTVRTSTEGDTLIRRNEMLIVVMARYGGQLERGACAALTTTAPA